MLKDRKEWDELDEKSLITDAQKGNRLAMNMLLEDNYEILYKFLLKTTQNEELSKDLVQETMIKAVVHLKSFKADSKFSTWLIRISINTYKNYIRQNQRQRHQQVPLEMFDPFGVSSQDVEKDVILHQQILEINKYLMTIKPKDRIIFVLKYYEGYSYEEISTIVNIKIGTCKSKMHYLMEKLRKELEVEL
jgi:RNA polymerase sigma-70 factor (ECF subfamily)